jgi:hypothetical protein
MSPLNSNNLIKIGFKDVFLSHVMLNDRLPEKILPENSSIESPKIGAPYLLR